MAGAGQGDGGCGRLLQVLSALRATRRGLPVNLTAAAQAGDVEAMARFVAQGADLDERTVGFASPLVAASAAGQLAAVRWLLARGAAVEPAGAVVTPLHAAVTHGHDQVASELAARGAKLSGAARALVEAQDVAAARAARAQLAVELERGRGEAPVAPLGERPALVEEALALIAALADATATDADGEGLLGLAARTGELALVEALLAAGADPGQRSRLTGFSPLHRAAEHGHVEVTKRLLDAGADGRALAAGRVSPLMLAAQFGAPAVVELLLARGASVAAKDVNGRSARHYAAGPFTAEILSMLKRGQR